MYLKIKNIINLHFNFSISNMVSKECKSAKSILVDKINFYAVLCPVTRARKRMY